MKAEDLLGKRLIIQCKLSDVTPGEPFEVTITEVAKDNQLVKTPKMQGGILKWVPIDEIKVLEVLPDIKPTVNNEYMRELFAQELSANSYSDVIVPREVAVHALKNCFK